MTEIYDEIGYIKEILEKGLSDRWQRDARLLARFYKMEGYSLEKIESLIEKKCIALEGFNLDVQYQEVEDIVNAAWNDKKELRTVKSVEFPKEVLQWFLDLEKLELSEEDYKYIKERREKYNIKIEKNIFNFERIKMLFTYYIWYLIQLKYTDADKAKVFPINRQQKRVRQDAYLKDNFKVIAELNLMYDLKYFYITDGYVDKNNNIKDRKLIATFIDKDIFKTPLTKENKVVLSGGSLYDSGKWLQGQRYGSFICKKCGKITCYNSEKPQEKSKIYCKECSDIIRHNKFDGDSKIIICQDCKKEVVISVKDNSTCRCSECQSKVDKEKTNQRVKKYYEKHGR